MQSSFYPQIFMWFIKMSGVYKPYWYEYYSMGTIYVRNCCLTPWGRGWKNTWVHITMHNGCRRPHSIWGSDFHCRFFSVRKKQQPSLYDDVWLKYVKSICVLKNSQITMGSSLVVVVKTSFLILKTICVLKR